VLEKHLKGEVTLGTYQLDKCNKVKWLVFDVDPEHVDKPKETANALVTACISNTRFPKRSVLLEASRYPDFSFHIWILFLNPIPAKAAKWLGVKILEFSNINPKDVELFPKQVEIGSDGFGNCVKLPLGLHRAAKKWSQFLNLETWKPLQKNSISDAYGCSFAMEDLDKIVQLAEAPPQVQAKLCKTVYKATKKIRPCIIEALKTDLRGKTEHHRMRLAIAIEHLNASFSFEEVNALFKFQKDYNEKETRYQVEHAAKRGYKPFKCSNIRELGFCIGGSCPIFRRAKKQFEAKVEALL